ncbi:MAG TPA: deoxyguanosinetriphosphate triphosphohydrolase [Ruminococcaceae bacterium]|nr:deoxyguanosinetriphosphate triphosphohydrolase [Oscillospiraceae bacterium]
MKTVRETSEEIEKQTLSEFASLSVNTAGRARKEEKCELRTDYQRDRDRIIHSKAFRRLKHKTQVFLAPESDHYRTRLTHTLEVSQIARTIARALRLNEDLVEAIALGHDLGHTPFGHAGERALDGLWDEKFTHYEQSVRVCERLEKNGAGLNLTFEVLDGILHHTKGEWASTPEGKIVRLSDRIAYINHDIDDAVRAGIIEEGDIPFEITSALGHSKTARIDMLVKSVVNNSAGGDIRMDAGTDKYYNLLHEFLFERVYRNPTAKADESKVFGLVEGLWRYFGNNISKLPEEFIKIAEDEGEKRAVIDYIASMTDHFAVATYNNIFIPKFWTV